MSIYITGDTHGGIDIAKIHTKNFPQGKHLTRNDYLIVTGDFGIWSDKKTSEFLSWLTTKKKFTVLFVEGNHEDYNYLKTFPIVSKFNNKVRQISDSIFQLMRGEIYNIEGKTFFAFGGARSIDRYTANRQEGIDWFPEEESSYEEENRALDNLNKHNNKVDYIISHTCSKSTAVELSKLLGFYIEEFDNQNKFFEHIKNTIQYTGWFFGHFHTDLQINKKEIVLYKKILNLNQVFSNNENNF